MSAPPEQPWWTRVAHEAYVGVLWFVAVVLVLIPLHQRATVYANLDRATVDTAAFRIVGEPPEIGRSLPVYRFNPGWAFPIGHAEVTAVEDGWVHLRWDPSTFMWPMGVQGAVTAQGDGTVDLNVGADAELAVDQELILYEGRDRRGAVRVASVAEHTSTARITEGEGDLTGLTASPYIIPTHVAYLGSPALRYLEYAAFSGVLLWLFLRRIGGASDRLAASTRRAVAFVRGRPMALNLLLGLPASWFGAYTVVTILRVLWGAWTSRFGDPWPLVHETLDGAIPGVFAFLALQYYAVLWRTWRSPLLQFWEAVRYRVPEHRWMRWIPLVDRYRFNWLIHLVIVYFFADTLLLYLKQNIAVAGDIGWHALGLEFETWSQTLAALGRMVVTWPEPKTLELGFVMVRRLLYAACIIGCLIGYGHSVLSILFKRKAIRNVDFTIMGWVTAAICYSGLLGEVPEGLSPQWVGAEPAVTEGPLYVAIFTTEMVLNVLYTLSIYNLGTMFGLMVDKGVRTTGFYGVVRHPSYTLESIMFGAVTWIGWNHLGAVFTCLVFLVIYWIRSEREDVFMTESNADYRRYRADVPYKLLPGIY